MILYYITLLLVPFNNHPLLSYNVGGITPVKLAGGLAFAWAIVYWLAKKSQEHSLKSRANKYFIIYVGLFLFATFNNIDLYDQGVFLRFLSVCMFYFTTVLLLDSATKFRNSVLVLLLAMDIASAYILREWLLYGGLYQNFRPGGIFGDPNYFSASAVAVFPLAFFMVGQLKSAWLRAFCVGSLCLLVAALIMAQSRGGLIGFGVVLLLLVYRTRFRKRAIAVLAALIAAALALAPVDPGSRFSGEDGGVKVSTERRLELLHSGARMVRAHPWLGVGPGNFRNLSDQYSDTVAKKQLAHNSYLEIAAEMGIFALLAFLAMCWAAQRDLLRLLREGIETPPELRPVLMGVQVGMLGFLACGVFLSAEFEKVFWLFVFFSIAATRLCAVAPVPGKSRRRSGLARTAVTGDVAHARAGGGI